MTSFRTHRTRVHDTALPLHRRHSALRTCLTGFAPYGLRATYHHLTVSARIPRRLEADPEALVRAVEELHEARELWLARFAEHVAQRRAEKRAGRRRPARTPWWDRPRWDAPDSAWAHDPFLHPRLSLPEYVRRQNALLDGAELPGCPACGEEGPAVPVEAGPGTAELCRSCGWVLVPCPCPWWHHFEPVQRVGWDRTWRREHLTDSAEPNPYWPRAQGAERVALLAVHHQQPTF
ncbi:hypothetical protein ACPC54_02915 [Kitasatospora sp. NPDC094028]